MSWARNFALTAQKVVETGRSEMTPFFTDVKGNPLQTYFTPLRKTGQGRPIGILAVTVYYEKNQPYPFLRGLKLSQNNFVVLTDRQGNSLVHDGLQQTDWLALLQPVFQDMAADLRKDDNKSVVFRDVTLGKRQNYTLFSGSLPSLQLSFTIGVSHITTSEKTGALMRFLYVILALGLLSAFAISIRVTRKISAPLSALFLGLQRLHQGDFSSHIDYQGKDELGDICASVNKLSSKIEKAQFLNHLWSEDR